MKKKHNGSSVPNIALEHNSFIIEQSERMYGMDVISISCLVWSGLLNIRN